MKHMNSINKLHRTATIFEVNCIYKSLSNKGQDQMRTVTKVSFFPHGLVFPALYLAKENMSSVGAKVCFKESHF